MMVSHQRFGPLQLFSATHRCTFSPLTSVKRISFKKKHKKTLSPALTACQFLKDGGEKKNVKVSVLLLHDSVHKHGLCQAVPAGLRLNAAQPQHGQSERSASENGSCLDGCSRRHRSALYCRRAQHVARWSFSGADSL